MTIDRAQKAVETPKVYRRSFSKLEMLIGKHESSGAADQLFEILHSGFLLPELLRLRFVCKIFEHWITSSHLFGTLYIDPWFTCTKDQQWPALQNVSALCRELIVNLPTSSPPCRPSTGIVFDHSPTLLPSNDWFNIFTALTNLRILTLRTPPNRLQGSSQSYGTAGLLSLLRESFEKSTTKCNSFRVHLLDSSLLLFLKWNGPSYSSAKWLAQAVWTNITTLELQLVPPARYAQQDTTRILHCWLRSFEKGLRVLKFTWLYGNKANRGPHPLALDLVLPAKTFSQKPLECRDLREMWVGNCAKEENVRPLLQWRAASLEKYMVFLERTGEGEVLEFDESKEPWAEVDLDELRQARENEQVTALPYDGDLLSKNSYDEVLSVLKRMERLSQNS